MLYAGRCPWLGLCILSRLFALVVYTPHFPASPNTTASRYRRVIGARWMSLYWVCCTVAVDEERI